MKVLAEYGAKMFNGTLFGDPFENPNHPGSSSSGSWEQRAERMNELSSKVRQIALVLNQSDLGAQATTWCFRALCRLGIVEREDHDSSIPCEAWQYAMEAGLTPAHVVAFGSGCGTIGCQGAPVVVIEHGPIDQREKDLVCWDCACSYTRRRSLGVAFLADVVNGDGAKVPCGASEYDNALHAAATVGMGLPLGALKALGE